MPELAEVETVRRVLEKNVLNKKIVKVDIMYPKIVESDISKFIKVLENNTFKSIKRVGKWLIFELDNYYLLSHLRMEGKYFIKDRNLPIEKHEHVIITFMDNTTLRYHDTRKFGRMKLIKKEDLSKELNSLGKEVIDSSLTGSYLYNKIHNKNISIKTVLLDQSVISGLGNIYVNEVLFASLILPTRLASSITLDECNSIVLNASRILNKAIEYGGTTIKSYTSSLGVTGHYQEFLMVHKRENELCKICGTKIINIKVNGRSTYYCPRCQK